MTQVLNPHLARQCIVTSLADGVLNDPIIVPVPSAAKPLRFPDKLLRAIGSGDNDDDFGNSESILNDAPTISVCEQGTGYLDGCLKASMVPQGKIAIKGSDQYGRVFFAFLMHNDNYASIDHGMSTPAQRCVLFTIFQRYYGDNVNESAFNHRWCCDAPTNDLNFISSCSMNDAKYASIAQVFAGTHADLKLGRPKTE